MRTILLLVLLASSPWMVHADADEACPAKVEALAAKVPAAVVRKWGQLIERFHSASARGFHHYARLDERQREFMLGVLLPIMGEAILFRNPKMDIEAAFRPWEVVPRKIVIAGKPGSFPPVAVVWSSIDKQLAIKESDGVKQLVIPETFKWSSEGVRTFVPVFFPRWFDGHPFLRFFKKFADEPYANAGYLRLPLAKKL